MPPWTIRVKLLVGLTLVVGMMLTLLGGAIFGLRSFHHANLSLTDQLRELGASKKLLEFVVQIDASHPRTAEERGRLERQAIGAREALIGYFQELRQNAIRGSRADDGRDESGLAFQIDCDLTAILAELRPDKPVGYALPGTPGYLGRHPDVDRLDDQGVTDAERLGQRIERLKGSVLSLPDKLHRDFYTVIEASKKQYQSSRVIVWSAALAVLAMLCALAALLNRWVLYPVRLLHRGVRKVARGAFDFRIGLETGDEMQALAEAFNEMTAKLGATYADLERQVNERSRQLVRSERLAGVGFLAAGVAHEINNPLASIAFCSEALENRLAPVLGGDAPVDAKLVRNYLRMIQEEAFRCKRITEKLLDFSRCNDIQRQRTDLVELVDGVVEMMRHMGKYRGKHIVFQPREAVVVMADPQEIKQVALNLVVNALDCMETGGTLRIDLRVAGGRAVLSFADDGCGMEPEVLDNIFEPFFTRRRVGKGTGLGLSITHRIVSQHQGEIAAESPGPGRGATFTVRLPLPGGEGVAGEATTSAPAAA